MRFYHTRGRDSSRQCFHSLHLPAPRTVECRCLALSVWWEHLRTDTRRQATWKQLDSNEDWGNWSTGYLHPGGSVGSICYHHRASRPACSSHQPESRAFQEGSTPCHCSSY